MQKLLDFPVQTISIIMIEEEEVLEVEEVAAVAEAVKEDMEEVAMVAMVAMVVMVVKAVMAAMVVMEVKEVIIKDIMEIIAKAIINRMNINQIEEDTKDLEEDFINQATVEVEVEEVAIRNNREEDTIAKTKTKTNNDLVISY